MKILIVEDEEALAQSLKKGLEKEGFAVDYLMDGDAAERRLTISHRDYDLVIMDWMLPKKDGVTVCKNLRALKVDLPIIMLTARVETSDRVDALDTGCDDYLIKPFSLEELLARIRALLRRPKEALPIELKVQDLTLDTATHKVIRHGQEIILTVKEFALLEYLMRHPNQVINRNQLLDHLWGYDFDSFSNIVDVHIKNLRKKINNHSRQILETVRGIGYRLRTTA